MPLMRVSSRWLARFASGLVHLVFGVTLLLASTSPGSSARPSAAANGPTSDFGWHQLKGDQRKRPAGRDVLFEILKADDGALVRLTSPTGDEAVGLAWWSPSRGLWLAVDLASSHAGETLDVSQRTSDGSRSTVAQVEIGADGSGRIIALWDAGEKPKPAGPVTLSLTSRHGLWPFGQRSVILIGNSRRQASGLVSERLLQ